MKKANPQQPDNFFGSWGRNLFGAIASNSLLNWVRPGVDRIPIDGSGGTINISGKGQQALWLGLKNPLMQKYAYEYCYPVASVCDRLAEADTTGKVEIIKVKGKGKEDLAKGTWATEMNKLLAQPNPMQTWEQFRGQQVVYKKVFGFCPVLPIVRAGFEDVESMKYSALVNIPPWCIEPVSTGKFLYQTSAQGLIQEYKVTILGKAFTLKAEQLFMITDSFLQDESKGFLVPMSRLVGLDMAVSNLCAAMEADNVMLRRSGPAGIFSPPGKDGTGAAVAMQPEEREEVQQDLSSYGMTWSQMQFMISRNPLTLQTIGFNSKQLGSKETIVASEKAVCHRYNYSYILYEDSGATYANQSGAHKSFFQNNVIPNAYKDMNEYNKFFKSEEQGCLICVDYSHLPILQENAKEKADAAVAWNTAYTTLYDNNLITKNQWLAAQGLEQLPDGDQYKGDQQNADPLAIRLGVGGTESLLAILGSTTLDPEAKINTLELLFGLSRADATQMVGNPKENETTAQQPGASGAQPGATQGDPAAGQGEEEETGGSQTDPEA